ncbi:MAG: hypothetical protein HC905_12025 [Bacteroidales bacterium]|nr:hypothetical protein [Bacteroidales bacterium]
MPANTYNVRVVDWGGCVGNTSVTIVEPDPLLVDFTKEDLICHSLPTGKIDLMPQGGTLPYEYIWSNGSRTQSATKLKAGDYLIVVRDSSLCSYNLLVTLDQPEKIVLSKDILLPYCPDSEDGSISINATGGTGGILYRWNDGSTLSELQQIAAGKYIVTVTDGNNCLLTDTTLLEPENSGCVDVPNVFSPNDDGVNDTWDIRAGSPDALDNKVMDLYPEAVMEVYNRWGVLIL